jgi:hypothetical protein
VELHQELHGQDFANRVAFCEWAEERVVFTDECCVKNNGAVNKHNLHYWAIQNPHWMTEQDIQNLGPLMSGEVLSTIGLWVH